MAEQTLQELRKVRIEKLRKLQELGIDPYPSKINIKGKTSKIAVVRNSAPGKFLVAGRVWSIRKHGAVAFLDLKDDTGIIQLLFQRKVLDAEFETLSLLDTGDFLCVLGELITTQAGELTISVEKFQLLTKSIRPLPSTWFGLKDEEERYRQRYVDLLLNDDLKSLFIKKALFWQSMRGFLIDKGFIEVETPVLENTAGGADANPFITHHNALDIDLYLRISMGELWQKRLMVAGFGKTFEIGRQFRNEGIDREHLQDYTQMEFYWGYANYEDSMGLVEEMYKYVATKTFGTLKFEIGDHKVDMEGSWEKIDYRETILKDTGIDISKATEEEIRKELDKRRQAYDKSDERGRLIDSLWKSIRKKITGPVFLTGHPVEVSPLAKRMADAPEYVERYQVIIAGSENGNGYSELNDPIDQAKRFAEQEKMREAGDAEAQMMDNDFVRALEYGMPPTSGFGVSERLFSFLAEKSIRETVLFPLLRPEGKDIKKVSLGKEIETEDQLPDENEYKFYAVIRKDIDKGRAMNALGHASVGLGGGSGLANSMQFLKYEDKDGNPHPNISHYNYIVLEADNSQVIYKVRVEAVKRGIAFADFTSTMTLGKSVDQMKATKGTAGQELDYYGIVMFGKTKEIKEFTSKLSLFK